MAMISKVTTPDNSQYSIRAGAIPYGECDSTSTSTAFTATVSGITELADGTCMLLKNGVVTSASGFTINVNNLGAKPAYSNMATGNDVTPKVPTRETTIFNINYTMLFVYSSDIESDGGWICYRGYDANTNTIGYQLRTNSTLLKTTDRSRYYRLFFTSADDTHWVPANAQYDNSATSTKTVNQRPINPFGRIIYMSASTNFAAEANLSATAVWDQYVLNLGYSFNWTGAALKLTTQKAVYVKCSPQSDGSVIMDSSEPIVQELPTASDGKVYIFLGMAYSATNIELVPEHPVYWHDGTGIRLWNGAVVPTKVSDLTNDSGFITSYTETDPTVPSWAKASTKPTYTASEVGALPSDTAIPSKTSDLTNDSGFITDAGVTSFNGSTGAVTYTAPVTSVNTKTGAVSLTASDVGASVVSINRKTTSGTNIADITIDGTTTQLYAPTSGSGGDVTDVTVDGTSVVSNNVAEIDLTGKVDKETGKGLSANDFTDTLKDKLNGIDDGAEVNQNAFSTVKVGTTNLVADAKSDTLTITAGNNITLTPTASSDSFSISATDTTYSGTGLISVNSSHVISTTATKNTIGGRYNTAVWKASASVASDSWVAKGSLSLSAGWHVLSFTVNWAASSATTKQYRSSLSTTSADEEPAYSCIFSPTGQPFRYEQTCIVHPTASTTYYFNLWQNTGAAINCSVYLNYLSIT